MLLILQLTQLPITNSNRLHCHTPQLLASGTDNLDAACSGSDRLWQVLSARYGTLLLAASGGQGDAGAAPPQPGGASFSHPLRPPPHPRLRLIAGSA